MQMAHLLQTAAILTFHSKITSGISFHKLVKVREKRKQNSLQTIHGFCQRRQDTCISQAVYITCTSVLYAGCNYASNLVLN